MSENKQTNGSQSSVISQFVMDNEISRGTTTNFDVEANNIKKLLECMRKHPEPGDVVIKGKLSPNGGNLEILQIVKCGLVETTDSGDYLHSRYSNPILVEPVNYPYVEPYNRQSPFYIGYSYASLTKHTTDKFSVYTTALCPIEQRNNQAQIIISLNDFSYNEYWKTVGFGLAIDRDNVDEFLTTLIRIIGYGDDVSNIVTKYVKEVIESHIDPNEITG